MKFFLFPICSLCGTKWKWFWVKFSSNDYTPYFMPTFLFGMLCDNEVNYIFCCCYWLLKKRPYQYSTLYTANVHWTDETHWRTVVVYVLFVLIYMLQSMFSIAPNPTRSVSVFFTLFNALLLWLRKVSIHES